MFILALVRRRKSIPWSFVGLLGDVEVFKNLAINQYHKLTELANTNVERSELQGPLKMTLLQNYPNPFNPETTIEFTIPESRSVDITIFNIMGQAIRHLVDENYNAGSYMVAWDCRDDNGARVTSGIYLYRIQAGEFVSTRKNDFSKIVFCKGWAMVRAFLLH